KVFTLSLTKIRTNQIVGAWTVDIGRHTGPGGNWKILAISGMLFAVLTSLSWTRTVSRWKSLWERFGLFAILPVVAFALTRRRSDVQLLTFSERYFNKGCRP